MHQGPSNRLIDETSPYLLQHAHNPVDWYPWGPEALARAASEDKPILLSIGYSACHWCHVMERESFENEATAALMNEHYVCIKVDREERPDLDDVYMQATLALNHGQGGWPMTVFLTPSGEPFFAGTYFPPEDRWGRPGFPTLLRRLAEAWSDDRQELLGRGSRLTEALRREARSGEARRIGSAQLAQAVEGLRQEFDPVYGGFGGAPKFPPTGALLLLLRHHQDTGDPQALQMVEKTLHAMAEGGIYDHVGGGFARYSTDERWLVPHFEKMLYDNALLTRVYLEAWQVTGDEAYRRVAREVLDYIGREMTHPDGGFYSATDADSEGVEGKFFVWTPAQVAALLKVPDAALFCDAYDIEAGGNWEGHSIPNRARPLADIAREHGLSIDEAEHRLAAARQVLYDARRTRVPPGLDDKILTGWNGLMIGALAEGGRVLDEPAYVQAAQRAADFLERELRQPDGSWRRAFRAGRAQHRAVLEDYAFLCDASIDLYEAGGRPRDLERATALAERMLSGFRDAESGAFFTTDHEHEALIVRRLDAQDGAIPSPNAIAAQALARLAIHLDRPELAQAAQGALEAFGRLAARVPRAFLRSLIAWQWVAEGAIELVLVGDPEAAAMRALRAALGRRFLPRHVVAMHGPLTQSRPEVDGRPTLYICRRGACLLPITDAGAIDAALARAHAEPGTDAGAPRTAGAATAEATAAFAAQRGGVGYRRLGRTGLTVSRIGFGAYRLEDDAPEQRDALRLALREGVNLIDTSTNYTDGGSETVIGDVLHEAFRGPDIAQRSQIVVVSKIGYVQGQNLALAQARARGGHGFPDMVEYAEGCWHCIHPEFLADQLGRSLARLQLETLDVCLLHNPEYFFSDAHKRGERDLGGLRHEFARRLREAFAFFEGEVSRGRVRWYGVSSNTLVAPADHPEATSLTAMLDAARAAGGEQHHFGVVQLPLNLLESGAVLERSHDGRSVLEWAQSHAIGVLANRPLNAFARTGLLRLAEIAADGPPAGISTPTVVESLAEVAALEADLGRSLDLQVRDGRGVMPIARLFAWADELGRLQAEQQGIVAWRELEREAIRPQLHRVLGLLDAGLPAAASAVWEARREAYVRALSGLLRACAQAAVQVTERQLAPIRAAVSSHLPAERRSQTLSRQALEIVASTPGVSAVLNGMRSSAQVRDSLEVLARADLENVRPIYEGVRTP